MPCNATPFIVLLHCGPPCHLLAISGAEVTVSGSCQGSTIGCPPQSPPSCGVGMETEWWRVLNGSGWSLGCGVAPYALDFHSKSSQSRRIFSSVTPFPTSNEVSHAVLENFLFPPPSTYKLKAKMNKGAQQVSTKAMGRYNK